MFDKYSTANLSNYRMSKSIIKQLRKNKAVMEEVAMWLVKNEFDKQYKKCNSQLSDACIGVGNAQFHGRRCPECNNAYKRQNYAEKKASTKKKNK